MRKLFSVLGRRLLAAPVVILMMAGGVVAVAGAPASADTVFGYVISNNAAYTDYHQNIVGMRYLKVCDTKADGHHVEGQVNWYSWDAQTGGSTGASNYNGNGSCVTKPMPSIGCDLQVTLYASVWEGGTLLSQASKIVNVNWC